MSPVVVNGRSLGVAHNGIFNDANTDPIPGGKLWPEAALTWNAMRAEALRQGIAAGDFMPSGPNASARTLAAQDHFWYLYQHGGNPAAHPGTSNHGWGLAVDVLGTRAQAWIMAHGLKYGWSHDEGARVGESWHMRYVGAPDSLLRKLRAGADPLRVLNSTERRWVEEYDRLKKLGRNKPRRRALRAAMKAERQLIHDKATHEKDGWHKANRLQRFRILAARS